MAHKILTAIFPLVLLLISGASFSAEEAKYSIIDSNDGFEVRYYDSHILAEVIVPGDFEEAGSTAFRPLFNYITGNNIARQEISMTAPVSQERRSQSIAMTSPVGQTAVDGAWVVSFMMPAEFSMDTLPQPLESQVSLRVVPARYIASVKYSGFWSQAGYEKHYKELSKWISDKGLRSVGEPIWARYNAPFTPWFLRRNEVLIPIEKPDTDGA